MIKVKPVSNLRIRFNQISNFTLTSNEPIYKVENPNFEVTYINNVMVYNLNST